MLAHYTVESRFLGSQSRNRDSTVFITSRLALLGELSTVVILASRTE